jgi:hypothetical protein
LTGGPPLDAGRRLTVSIDLADQQPPIEVHAKVAWTRTVGYGDQPAGSGVRFVRMDDAARRRLEQVFAAHTLTPHEIIDEPVKVQLPGLPSRLRARAREVMGKTLVVEADLPWLPIGATVATELGQGDVRDGKLVWVGVETGPNGLARLTLNIELDDEPTIDIELEADYEEPTTPLH